MSEPLLAVDNLSRRFGGLMALSAVSFAVAEGELRGVIGPNGAGKTTLFNVLTGLMQPSSGQIRFAGHDITGQPLHCMARYGIARTFQNLQLCPGLSVLDNVLLGAHHLGHAGVLEAVLRGRRERDEERSARRLAAQTLEMVGLTGMEDASVGGLSFGHRKMLEIARSLASRPRLLLLDEPAAGLNHGEKQALMTVIRSIRGAGVTVLLVEHDMRLVMSLCDNITVLDYGRKIADDVPERVQSDPTVINAYLGTPEEEAPDA